MPPRQSTRAAARSQTTAQSKPTTRSHKTAQSKSKSELAGTCSSFSLLELPPEIRHKILEYCFLPPYPQQVKQLDSTSPRFFNRCAHPNLPQLCRTIRDECLEQYVRTHTLHFPETLSFANNTLSYLSTPVIKQIRHISLDMHDVSTTCNGCRILSKQGLFTPCRCSDLAKELRRLIVLAENYPELCDLEQLDIRLSKVYALQGPDAQLFRTILAVAKRFMAALERRCEPGCFLVRPSFMGSLGWISLHRVSVAQWKKVPEKRDVVAPRGCASGCGNAGIHLCSKNEGLLVRSDDRAVYKIMNAECDGDLPAVKGAEGTTWRVIAPLRRRDDMIRDACGPVWEDAVKYVFKVPLVV